MKVISNSSILIGLSAIGHLELLHRRFPEGVIVPDAVWREVVETGHGRTGAEHVATAEWICRQQIQNKVFATALQDGRGLAKRSFRYSHVAGKNRGRL